MEFTQFPITTKLVLEVDPALAEGRDPLGKLPLHIRQEVMDRIGFGLQSVAYFSFPQNPAPDTEPAIAAMLERLDDYQPREVTIWVRKEMAYDEDGPSLEGARWQPYYLPVKASGLSTELWGVVVGYEDPDDGSSGSYIYRDATGNFDHWM